MEETLTPQERRALIENIKDTAIERSVLHHYGLSEKEAETFGAFEELRSPQRKPTTSSRNSSKRPVKIRPSYARREIGMSKSQDRLNALAEEVASRLIEQLEKGTAPWQKPGTASPVARTIRSLHHSTRGANWLCLQMAAEMQGFLILAG